MQPFVEVDGQTRTQRTWELGVIEFAGGERGVYQWPIGTTHGNGWEVVGTQGVIAGNEVVLWEDSRSRRGRRLPIETVLGTTADGSETITHAQLASEPPLTWHNPYYRQYALPSPDDVARADTWLGLHRSIVEGRPAVYGASARTDLELLIAIRESSRQGGPPAGPAAARADGAGTAAARGIRAAVRGRAVRGRRGAADAPVPGAQSHPFAL